MDTLKTVEELAQIIRGEHPAWRGDRIENSEMFLRTIKRDFPDEVGSLVEDIERNAADLSELIGISPARVQWIANRLKEQQ